MKAIDIIINKPWLHTNHACADGILWLKNHTGIGAKAGDILRDVLTDEKWDYFWWLAVRLMTRPQKVEFAIFAAEQVIAIFEKKYPNDDRPRRAIQAAKDWRANPSVANEEACVLARRAAAAAADAAAADAADAAAADAAADAYADAAAADAYADAAAADAYADAAAADAAAAAADAAACAAYAYAGACAAYAAYDAAYAAYAAAYAAAYTAAHAAAYADAAAAAYEKMWRVLGLKVIEILSAE